MRRPLHALAAAALLVVSSTAAVLIGATVASADTQTCEKFGSVRIQNGRYIVQNNVWGADTPQCLNVTDTGFSVTSAGHNKATNGAPAAYPSAFFGCHFGNCSTGSGLPVQVSTSQFASLQSSVSMTYPSSGTWNAAYDIWLDPTARTTGQNTGAEIMIWLNRQGSIQPIGSPVGTANINGATWEVWFGNVGWNVVSYLRTTPTTSLNFTVNDFVTDSINRGHAQRSWFLTSIQAGFEPWIGGAGLAVNSFSVSSGNPGPGPSPTTSPTPGPTSSPTPGPGTGGCQVRYVANTWNTGFTAEITVTNRGTTTINGWTLTFNFPGNQQATQAWNATATQSGSAVTARNLSWNAVIAPSASVNFGMQGTYSGTNAAPTNFALNGTPCTTG